MEIKDKISIMNQARIKKRRDRDLKVRREAVDFFENHKDESLFLSGVALYWAEGTRLSNKYRKYQLAFTNSEGVIIGFYCKFLEKYFSDFTKRDWRAELFLYPDIEIQKAVSYWSDILKIPAIQFIKPQILNGNGLQNGKLRFGTCCIYINSKDACLKMQEWINSIGNFAAVIQR